MAKTKSIAPTVPAAVQDRIDAQRGRLQLCRAVLFALEYAAIHDAEELDAGSVTGLVIDVLDEVIDKLDSVELIALLKQKEKRKQKRKPAPRRRKK